MQSIHFSWSLVVLVFTVLTSFCTVSAEESTWPAWRGLHRDGKSLDTGLLKSWPQGGPTRLWEVEGMDWDFYHDVARHCYDECRHAKMGEERVDHRRHSIGRGIQRANSERLRSEFRTGTQRTQNEYAVSGNRAASRR